MKNIKAVLFSAIFALSLAGIAGAQTSLTQTTLSSAIDSSQRTFQIASATGVIAGSTLAFVDNEAMPITGLNGTLITVAPRGSAGTKGVAHISGAMVLIGPRAAFIGYEPSGTCVAGQGLFLYSPVINITSGNQWLCGLAGKVVPGWSNVSDGAQVTTAVASAAGVVTPSGPLFHITGALAITGFTLPVGFDPKGGPQNVCAIPDGTFTTTAAGNIALASTAVVSKILCWTYDSQTTKFYPTY